MYVQEMDRPFYVLVSKRGFDDKELKLTTEQELVVRNIIEDGMALQFWLREVYKAGDQSDRVTRPQWLVNQAAELARVKPVTDLASSKKSRTKLNETE